MLRTKFVKKRSSRDKNFKKEFSTPEFSFVPSFIPNKVLENFETKFAQKRYFRDEIRENNCRIQNMQPPLNTLLHWVSFKTKHFKALRPNLSKKGILVTDFKNTSWTQNQHPSIPFCFEFHFMQVLSSFETKFAPKKYFGDDI